MCILLVTYQWSVMLFLQFCEATRWLPGTQIIRLPQQAIEDNGHKN